MAPLQPGCCDDPYARIAPLSADDPVHQSPLGVWILFRHEDVKRVVRDPSMRVEFDNAAPTPVMSSRVDDVPGARRDRRRRRSSISTRPTARACAGSCRGPFTPKMVEAVSQRGQARVDEGWTTRHPTTPLPGLHGLQVPERRVARQSSSRRAEMNAS